MLLAVFVIGGIVSIFDHGGYDQPSTTDNYPAVASAPSSDTLPVDAPTYDPSTTVPAGPTQDYTGGSGGLGGDIDPPGHGYGPGVDGHLSGCYVHGSHIGWHW